MRAFTLIEMLLAVAICAIVLVAIMKRLITMHTHSSLLYWCGVKYSAPQDSVARVAPMSM